MLGFVYFTWESCALCNEYWEPEWRLRGEMGSLSRPEFAWLMNRLRSRSSEFKAQCCLARLLCCCSCCNECNKCLRLSTVDKFEQTGFILLGALLLNQLMYLNTLVLISATATKPALLSEITWMNRKSVSECCGLKFVRKLYVALHTNILKYS